MYVKQEVPDWLVSLDGIRRNNVGLKVKTFKETFPITIYSKDGIYKDKFGYSTIPISFDLNTFVICTEKALVEFIRIIMIYLYATTPEAEFLFGTGSVNDDTRYDAILGHIGNVLASIAFNVVYSPSCGKTSFYKIFESLGPGRDRGIIDTDNLRVSIISKARKGRRLSLDEEEFIRTVKARIPVRNDPVSASAAAAAAASAKAYGVASLPNSPPVATLEQSIFNYLIDGNPTLSGTPPSDNMIAFIRLLIKNGIHKDKYTIALLKESVFDNSDDSKEIYSVVDGFTNDTDRGKFINHFLEKANEAEAEAEARDKEGVPSSNSARYSRPPAGAGYSGPSSYSSQQSQSELRKAAGVASAVGSYNAFGSVRPDPHPWFSRCKVPLGYPFPEGYDMYNHSIMPPCPGEARGGRRRRTHKKRSTKRRITKHKRRRN